MPVDDAFGVLAWSYGDSFFHYDGAFYNTEAEDAYRTAGGGLVASIILLNLSLETAIGIFSFRAPFLALFFFPTPLLA